MPRRSACSSARARRLYSDDEGPTSVPLARIRGIVEEKGDDWLIVGVGGIGLLASVPARTAAALDIGRPAALFTHLHVREDALTLFGFESREHLTLFEQLISVTGIGPRA